MTTVLRNKCGTLAGYAAHNHRHEVPCSSCVEASVEYARSWRRRRIFQGAPELLAARPELAELRAPGAFALDAARWAA